MYIECMHKIPKEANVEQAKQMLIQNSFVYNNPCCKCHKQCSTPTKDIWMRRIKEFGSIEAMYAQYKCRKCRKSNDALSIAPIIATAPIAGVVAVAPIADAVAVEPLRCIAKQPAMMKKKEERPMVQIRSCKPPHEVGKDVMHKPGHFAFSVWEDGVFKGTTYYKHSGKEVD
jgi:hypothetical protein